VVAENIRLAPLKSFEGICLVREHGDPARLWKHLANKLNYLVCDFVSPARQSRDVSAGPGEADNEPRPDGIAHPGHHDGDLARRLFRRCGFRRLKRNDNINVDTNQF
jgi:hypothetical protein